MSQTSASPFDRLGADKLRAVLTDFYNRIFADVMIGFLFAGKDKQHLIDREYELTARLLGNPEVRYTGRPMREAHARSPILGGHFDRRLQLLRNVLRDHAVDTSIAEPWIDHQIALRPQITGDAGSECDHDVAAARLASDD